MKGIIIKDFYESFCLKKNMHSVIFGACVIPLILFLMPSMYTFILMIVLTIPMLGISTLQYSMEQDEISGYNRILLTFPLTRKQIVGSKIVATLILSALVDLLFMLPLTLVGVYVLKITTLQAGLFLWLLGCFVTFIMTPIYNIGFFALGNKKGTIIYILITIFLIGQFLWLHFSVGVEALLNLSKIKWILILAASALIINAVSYLLCVKIYTKKYS